MWLMNYESYVQQQVKLLEEVNKQTIKRKKKRY